MDLKELLERAIDCEQQGRLDEAVSAYVALVRDGWAYAAQLDPFERLLQIHLHRREIDAAWCAASILEGLDRLEGTERELYEDYVPRRLPVRRGRLDTATWELLRDPDEDMGLSAMLGAIAEKLAPPMDSRGIDSAVLAWAADALGARDGAVTLVDPALEAHADLDEVRAGYMLRERLFFAGREATALVAPYYALARCDPRKIKAALGASEVGTSRSGCARSGGRAFARDCSCAASPGSRARFCGRRARPTKISRSSPRSQSARSIIACAR